MQRRLLADAVQRRTTLRRDRKTWLHMMALALLTPALNLAVEEAAAQLELARRELALTAAPAVTRIRTNSEFLKHGSRPSGNCFTYWFVGATSCTSNILVAVIVPSAVAV